MDLKAAYDLVPHDRLFDKIRAKGFSIRYTNLFISLFTQCSTVAIINGKLTDPIPIGRGLFQGSILAPYLFNLFIDDLDDALNYTPTIRALLYADDIQTRNKSGDLASVQRDLQILSQWAVENDMKWGIHKCGIQDSAPLPIIPFLNASIPHTPTYRYLGFPHAAEGINFALHLEQRATSFQNTFQRVRSSSFLWPASLRLAMYRTFIGPTLE